MFQHYFVYLPQNNNINNKVTMKLTDLSNSIRSIMTLALLMLVMSIEAQTARKFTLNLTDDGKAQMVCFLPQTPSGQAIVGVLVVAIRCCRIRMRAPWPPIG